MHDDANLVSDLDGVSADKHLPLIRSLRIMKMSNEYIIKNFNREP